MLAAGLVRRGHRVLVAGPPEVEESFAFTEAGARFVPIRVSDRPHPLDDARSVLALRRLTRDADVVHAHGLRVGALTALALPGRAALLSGAGGRSSASREAMERGRESGSRSASGSASGSGSGSGVGAEVGARAGAGAPTSRAGRGRPALVVTLHNALTAGGFVGAVYGALERVVARRADHLLVVSPDLGERMRALGARDVRPAVVPAPVPRPAKRTPEEVRSDLGAGHRPIVLTLARLAQQKGLETLLDVARGPWAPLDATGEGAGGGIVGGEEAVGGEVAVPLFLVAGDGPLRGELQARIDAERLPVRLLGWRDDVPDLLAAAAVVVWPSRWEGQPLSLSETLMIGRPVVATAVGGVPDLLGGAGKLVPYGDAAAMRAAVRELVEDPAEAARVARAAARRGAKLPGEDDAVDSVLSVYRAATAGDD
ncbi:glycosyltransferase [Nonomuraea rhodomycinica]|uniref:Glycosyltransferase n=2 Tax=Nonomuraea rhodomycinica TaxID=1712872 RepID=A0A7Y6INP2_9ACTN|nr:glycosyltransferase [Nonomuraea rhodomycinica]